MNQNNGSSGSGSSDPSTIRRNSKRPKYSKFTQQELSACKPILTPGWVISSFLLVTGIFIPIGLAALSASNKVVEISERYDSVCIPEGKRGDKVGFIKSSENKTCTRMLTVPKNMKAPIYVYYQLDNFYQNHRRYVKSRSDEQLRNNKSEDATSTCSPEDQTDDGKTIVPCGLIAWSLFNDTYSFSLARNKTLSQKLTINTTNISWKSDREHKFGKNVFPKNFQNSSFIGGKKLENKSLNEQEDLIVWMRTAALPNFRKMYGRIEVDLLKDDKIEVILENNYNTYSFNGKKTLVLSTTTWIGGKNEFLGIAYLVVGGLCGALALCFSIVYLVKPRRLGDPTYLSWNRNAGGH